MANKRVIKGIIQSAKPAMTKNNQPYQVATVLTINDAKQVESLQISIWGASPKDTPYGKQLNATAQDDNGFLSATLADIRIATPSAELQELLPTPPTKDIWMVLAFNIAKLIEQYPSYCAVNNYKLSSMLAQQSEQVTGQSPSDYPILAKEFITAMDRLSAPYSQGLGAVSNHHNFPGGLMQHTYELLNEFYYIYPSLEFQVNPFIVAVACLFHDFGKLSCYTQDFQYTPEISLLDHPYISAEAAGKYLSTRSISTRLIHFIQSAILSHHGRREWGAPVLPANPESFLVAKLDEISGHGQMYEKPSGTRAMDTTIQRF